MIETFAIRFMEYQRYDINRDCQVKRYMAMTNIGTWHTDVPVESAAKMRERREGFKTYVLGAIQAGLEPSEVTFG